MASILPTSGTIALSQLQTEFGGSNPIGLSEYYRGGLLVPNTAANGNIPISGTISMTNFYGASGDVFNAHISSSHPTNSATACSTIPFDSVYSTSPTPSLNFPIYTDSTGSTYKSAAFYTAYDAATDGDFVRYWGGGSWSGSAIACAGGGGGGLGKV